MTTMTDGEYNDLKLKVLITPEAERWPPPKYTHWERLHAVPTEARERVAKAFAAIDAVDKDANLSPAGRADQRRKIAEKALADFQKSSVLEDARRAVARQMQSWSDKVDQAIKRPAPEDAAMATLHAQVRSHIANIKEGGPAPRLGFIDKHFDDVIDAVLSAPPFLSGLNGTEYKLVRQKFERHVLGAEVAEARVAVEKAMQDAEKGWQRAIKAIAERGSLEKAA